jgi:hypothetical protein
MPHISSRHLKTQAKKFGFQQVEDEAIELVNDVQEKLVKKLLKSSHKKQCGGRVSLPIQYFSPSSSSNFTNSTTHTDISATDSSIRQSIPLNDPTGVLGTDKAFAPFVGGAQRKFEVLDKSVKAAIKQQQENNSNNMHQQSKQERQQQQHLARHAKTKFETLMTEVFSKVSKQANSSTLQESDLRKALSLKKYQAQLA